MQRRRSAARGGRTTAGHEPHQIDIGDKAEFAAIFIRAIRRTFADLPPDQLTQAVARGLAEAAQVNVPILSGHCEVARRIAERLGLPAEIRENLGQIYERWDGRGLPRGLSAARGRLNHVTPNTTSHRKTTTCNEQRDMNMMPATTKVEDFDQFLKDLLHQGRREAKAARLEGHRRLSRSRRGRACG